MRHAVVLAALALTGCGRFGFDATARGDDEPDATDGASPDGTSIDATADTATLEYVFTSSDDRPVNAIIWSSNLDGTVDDVTTFDAAYRAVLHVGAGATVSVWLGGAKTVLSYANVAAGDQLRTTTSPYDCTNDATITLSWDPLAGADHYDIDAPCDVRTVNAPTTSTTLKVRAGSTFQPVVRASGPTGDLLGTTAGPVATMVDGAQFGLPPTWELPASLTLGFTNLPAAVSSNPELELTASSGDGRWANEGQFHLVTSRTGTTATLDALLPGGLGGAQLGAYLPVTVGRNGYGVERRNWPVGIEALSTMPSLPDVVDYNVETRLATWTYAATSLTDDVTYVTVAFDDQSWSLVVPPGVTQVAFPQVPAGVPGYGSVTRVEVVTADFPDVSSYAQALARGDGRLGSLLVPSKIVPDTALVGFSSITMGSL